MQYPDIREYITFLFSMLDAFSATEEKVSKRGRPETYPDASLIVFLRRYDAQGDYRYARTTRLLISPSLLA